MRILDSRPNPRLLEELTERRLERNVEIERRTRDILDAVRAEGDEAVTTFTRQLDCPYIDVLGLRVGEKEIEGSYRLVPPALLRALRAARKSIGAYHRRQRPSSWTLRAPGSRLEQRYRALDRVGLYVPGGKAAYPSTVLMNAVPAVIAGVPQIVMTTPCNREGKIAPAVLVAAAECGITEIYRIGGAQAVGALAYGTESIRRVDKITGPGNAYVAEAKRLVFGMVGIDMIAGPTEVVIVADDTGRPEFIAADLLAQAEHDELASPICLTTSSSLARKVSEEVERRLADAPRRAVAARAFAGQGVIVLVPSLAAAADAVNALAPEHLEVMTRTPAAFARRVRHAGSIFLGPWSAEALGDYIAGPNHTLPTAGTARFSSPLGVTDFMKFSNVITLTRARVRAIAPHAEALADAEGLYGHAASVRIRREAKR